MPPQDEPTDQCFNSLHIFSLLNINAYNSGKDVNDQLVSFPYFIDQEAKVGEGK